MHYNVQSQLPGHQEFKPGVHLIHLETAVRTRYVREAFLDLRSQRRNASYCRIAFPLLQDTSPDEGLSQKLAEADKLFDWLHQVPTLPQRHLMISLVANLGCLIVGRHKPLHEMQKHAHRFAEAAFMESNLDGRFSRFIESLHEWALPEGMGDAFISYSRCLTRESQIFTLMFLESGLNLIGKLVNHATCEEGGSNAAPSYIILDGLDLLWESTDHADTFLCSVQDFAVSIGAVILGVSGHKPAEEKGSRHPSQAPAMAS